MGRLYGPVSQLDGLIQNGLVSLICTRIFTIMAHLLAPDQYTLLHGRSDIVHEKREC